VSFLGIVGKKTETIESTGFAPLLGEPKDTFKSIVVNAVINDIDIDEAITDAMDLKHPVSDKNWQYISKLQFKAINRATIEKALQRAGVVPDRDENGNPIYQEGNPLLLPEAMHDIMSRIYPDINWVGKVARLQYMGQEYDFKIVGQIPVEVKIDGKSAKIYIGYQVYYESVEEIPAFKGPPKKIHQTRLVYTYLMEPPEGFAEISFFVKSNGHWLIFDSEEFFEDLQDTDKFVIDKVVPLKVGGEWIAKRSLLQRCGIMNADELQEQLGKNKDVQIEYGILGTFLQWKIDTEEDRFKKLFDKLWFKVIDYYAPDIGMNTIYKIEYDAPGGQKLLYEIEAKTENDNFANEYYREIKDIWIKKNGIDHFYGKAFIVKGEKRKITFIPRAITIVLTDEEKKLLDKATALSDTYVVQSGLVDVGPKKFLSNDEATGRRYTTEDIEKRFFIPIPSLITREFKFKEYVDLYPAMFGLLYHTKQKITYTTIFGIKQSKFFKALGVVLTFVSAGTLSPAAAFVMSATSMAIQAGVGSDKVRMVAQIAMTIYGLYQGYQASGLNVKNIFDTLQAAMKLYDIYLQYELQSELSDFRKFKDEIEQKIKEYKNVRDIDVMIIDDMLKGNYETYYSFATDIMYLQDIIWNQLFQEQGMPDEEIVRQFES